MSPADGTSRFHAFSPPTLVLFALLAAGVISMAILDYLKVRQLTHDLAAETARTLITQVEQASARASLAESSVRGALTDHLFSVAHLLAERIGAGDPSGLNYSELLQVAGVARIDRFGPDMNWIGGSDLGYGALGRLHVPENLAAGQQDWVLGLFRASQMGEGYYGVASRLKDGGALRVAVSSSELLEIRRNVGLGALLKDLGDHPEVAYAILDSPDQLIAATPGLPDWVEQPGQETHDRALLASEFQTEVLGTPDGQVFEARTPFSGGDGVVLRLGLVIPGLQQIEARSRWGIAIRSSLLLALLLFLFAWFLNRQNLRLLADEKARIEGEVRALEAERVQREKLTAMGSLAGGVAHEIRNPLNTIGMAAQRLEHQIDPVKHREQFLKVVHSIREESRRIERIISDFLAFARPPKADRRLQNLARVLEPTLEGLASQAVAAGVRFEPEIPAGLNFHFDADQLRQAVLNLLRNGLEALQEAGQSDARLGITASQVGEKIQLDIVDNGPGIAEKDRERLFDLYYTTRASGSGIGLPMVQRIAQEHGGRVLVLDTKGGGATFRLELET